MSDLGLYTADVAPFSYAMATGPFAIKLDDPIFGSGGILLSYPQSLAHPYMAGSGSFIAFAGKLKWVRAELRLNLVGSQSNVLASGDLYSRVRVMVIWTKSPYLANYTINTFSIDSQADRRDGDVIFYDKVINLPSTAYDSANGYNVPGCRTLDINLPLWRLPHCDFFSAQSNTVFDTREGSFYLYMCSDSSVAPHPTVSGSSRIYFRKIDQ